MKVDDRIPSHPPVANDVFSEAPQRVILMTPLMSTVGALLVFFSVAVIVVVILPNVSMNPEPSINWAPYSDAALRGRAVYLANGCVYCHSGYTRPQDYFVGQNYLYPRVSEPGDYWEGDPSPNIFGTARTGPDLSQEGGNHPDGWHEAHYFSPRATTPISIMPRFVFFSDQDRADMIVFNQQQGGKEAYLRFAAVTVGNRLMRINGGMLDPEKAFPELVQQLNNDGSFNAAGKSSDKSPWGLPWELIWHVNSFERSYWLTDDPLALNQQNLMRGKTIYLERCAGCHGETGRGDGPAAQFLMPKPFNFAGGQANFPGASDGMFYHRILTAGPGTAMENFGSRLSVEDTWRVVLFLRTIQNGSLEQAIPTVEMWVQWEAPPPFLDYVDAHPLSDVTGIRQTLAQPFFAAAQWVAPGMAASDEIMIGGKLPMTLDRLAELIQFTYTQMLEESYTDALNRGDPLPAREEIFSMEGVEFHVP